MKTQQKWYVTSGLIFLISCGSLFAQTKFTKYGQAIHLAEVVVQEFMQENNVPGMSAAVGIGREIVWSEGFGYADLENNVKTTVQTRFRIGSVSKPVTAAALAILLEQGKLDLDSSIQTYVPTFPKKRWPITVREVAGHLAGIRHYRGQEFLNQKHYDTVLSGLTIFENDTLLFEPQTKFSYSSYGWNLLSAVVEGASGDSFLHFLKVHLFQPLQMQSITAEYPDSLITYRASFYRLDAKGNTLNAPYVDNSYKWAGGGFISGIEDLVTFGLAHLNHTFLKAETVKLLFQSQKTRDGKTTHYGIGWASGTDSKGRKWVGHSGGSIGGRAMLLLYPQKKMVIALLANLGSAKLNPALAEKVGTPFGGN